MLAVVKRAFKDFKDDECPVRAAALSYYMVFALPPLLILIVWVAGAIWDPSDVQQALEGQFAGLVGADAGRAIREMISSADRPGTGRGIAPILGVIALLFGATGAFVQLQDALNHAWEVKADPKRTGWRYFLLKRLLSLGMILGIAFLLLVSLALSALISAAGDTLTWIPEPALQIANTALSFVVTALLFGAMFKVLPDAPVAWRDVWVGALATAAFFALGKLAIGLYLGHSEPASAFGAASAVVVIFVWVYYAAMIVLFGAEFTQAWSSRRPPSSPELRSSS